MFDPLHRWAGAGGHNDLLLILDKNIKSAAAPCAACWWPLRLRPQHELASWAPQRLFKFLCLCEMRNENRQYFYTMSKRPPPPLHFPKPFANHRAENNSRTATHSATRPTASNSLRPEPAVHPPQGESTPSTLGACAMDACD